MGFRFADFPQQNQSIEIIIIVHMSYGQYSWLITINRG